MLASFNEKKKVVHSDRFSQLYMMLNVSLLITVMY